MKNMHLPEKVQENIRDFMHSSNCSLSNQEKMNHFCEMLPSSLKQLVINHIYISAVEQSCLLKYHTEAIKDMVGDLIPQMRKPDDIIV